MRDPHVEWLSYRMVIAPTIAFENPPPVERQTPGFGWTVRDGQVKFAFSLEEHYSTVEEAQLSVVPFLRDWEVYIGLTVGPGAIRFAYEDAGVIDRNPPQPGEPETIRALQGITSSTAFGVPALVLKLRNYPEPPGSFHVDRDVETLWNRYEGYKVGREPLSSMAYFCLTAIESTGRQNKRRAGAAKRYGLSCAVLDKLADLTSEKRGDPMTARKMGKSQVPYTPKETRWIEAAVKAIILRVGEAAARASSRQITMDDLPKL